jgi:hypothetical protein
MARGSGITARRAASATAAQDGKMNAIRAIIAAAGVVASFVAPPGAIARDVMWGGRSFHLPVPDGWCEIDPQDAVFASSKKLVSDGGLLLVYALPCDKIAAASSGKTVFDTLVWTGVLASDGKPASDSADSFVASTEKTARRATAGFQEAKAKGEAPPLRRGLKELDFRFLTSTSSAVFVATVWDAGSEQTGKTLGNFQLIQKDIVLSVEASTVILGSVFRVQRQGLRADGATEQAFVKAEKELLAGTAQAPQPRGARTESAPAKPPENAIEHTRAADTIVSWASDAVASTGFLLGAGATILAALIAGCAANWLYLVSQPPRGVLAYLLGATTGMIGAAGALMAERGADIAFDPTLPIIIGALIAAAVGILRAQRWLAAQPRVAQDRPGGRIGL